MKFSLKKIFSLNTKIDKKSYDFSGLLQRPDVIKLFEIFKSSSIQGEIRFVGGCVRNVLSNKLVDDIDIATNLQPEKVKEILLQNKINFYDVGISHGTITAVIDKKNFEITTLRCDVSTDGRHAKVEYTNDWSQDAARRDFSINSIYANNQGDLFDPNNGKEDLENGLIKFIGNPEERIKEDYLRILRYIRFHISYSKFPHSQSLKKIIKQNISGINKISKNRLLDELKKIFYSSDFINLFDDEFSLELLSLIFPELKNLNIFKKLNSDAIDLLYDKDFIFLIAVLIIDDSDNSDYFIFKYNISNEDKNRLKFLKKYYKEINKKNFFNEKNLSAINYYYGNKFTIDIIDLKIFLSQKVSLNILNLRNKFVAKPKPIFPVKAKKLIDTYNLKEGRELGAFLKELELIWIENNFKISDEEIKKVINK